jgi:hypothetical protein
VGTAAELGAPRGGAKLIKMSDDPGFERHPSAEPNFSGYEPYKARLGWRKKVLVLRK